jgi:hypothetical protein
MKSWPDDSRMEMFDRQSQDTGMALVLGLLLMLLASEQGWLIYAAMSAQVLNMTVPQVYRPLAVVWFALAEVFGTLMSKLVLSVVFFVVVTPVGWFRRAAGVDSLMLRAFKTGSGSVMEARNHRFTGTDLDRPY